MGRRRGLHLRRRQLPGELAVYVWHQAPDRAEPQGVRLQAGGHGADEAGEALQKVIEQYCSRVQNAVVANIKQMQNAKDILEKF